MKKVNASTNDFLEASNSASSGYVDIPPCANIIADMFIGYALMLREGQVFEGSVEALDVFRKEFVEVFENFAAIIYLQKQ